MRDLLLSFSLQRPKSLYALVIGLVFAMLAMFPLIQVDTDPENMLPESNPSRLFHNAVKQRFAMHDSIVVGVVNPAGIYNTDSLNRLYRLTESILKIDGVIQQDLMAISQVDNISQDGPGTIRFEWMMDKLLEDAAQAELLGEQIRRLPLLMNTLVSEDDMAAAIYVPIVAKQQSYQIAEQIRELFPQQGDEQYYLTGLPVAEDQFGVEMFIQMGISAPLAGLMIFVIMWWFFRSVPLVIGPMLVAMATVIITMGLLIGMGFTVHIMSSMIAIFLMPIAVVDSIHIMSEFADRYKPGKQVQVVLREVIGHLYTPMLFTSVTSTVGFLSLLLTPIPPVKIFGAFVGFGIMLAFLLTMTLLPAYISRLSPESLARLQQVMHNMDKGGWLADKLPALGQFAVKRPKMLLSLFLALFGLAIAGIVQIVINDNPTNWFKSSHEIRVADRALNKHFAGTYDAYLVLSSNNQSQLLSQLNQQLQQAKQELIAAGVEAADAEQWLVVESGQPFSEQLNSLYAQLDNLLFELDGRQLEQVESLLLSLEQMQQRSRVFLMPDTLNWLSGLQQHLQDSGLVGKSNSLSDLVKTVNRELRSGLAGEFVVPGSANGVAQVLLQYQSSHRPDDLWHFVTPDYRDGLLWLQLKSGDNQDMAAVMQMVSRYLQQHPAPEGVRADWAGKSYLNLVWQNAMVSGLVDSLMGAFVVVLLMMILLFRSVIFGLLAMLPLTLTITLMYGLIGWIGKDYDMPIAVLSALTLGLSVDFAIHFLERARSLWRETGDLQQTMQLMFEEPARAISRNAIVIALGFTPLLLAPLVPYITVGAFLASIMAISALVTLLLLPAMLQLLSHLLQNKL